ncbi:MAG: hypothetical protein JO007_16740 [Alphaproteobacteria bacterium]|nr:hypothetical protein [Alphaproteobacteria bacterium]
MNHSAKSGRRYRPAWMHDEALRSARTCYGHLAGRLGVALAESLIARGHIRLHDREGELSEEGARLLAELGLEIAGTAGRRRRFCRLCRDWSEGRPHLGGVVGAALAQCCFALGWIERVQASRAVLITPAGCGGFSRHFGVAIATIAKA